MDDVGKAIVMASQVLLFILACTVSIILYSNITDNIDEILLTKDFSNQGDSIVNNQDTDNTREIKRAEIILAILDLKNKPSGDKVIVDGDKYTYTSGSFKKNTAVIPSGSLYGTLMGIADTNYNLEYTNNTLEYTS